ncbi:TonB-dependent receptor [Chitinophaga sp. Mgbs1]|uniref:TonB-dependent receptor n=1 Tax=Chitinophaga solisilvae TaxID=1233460 RepID=A0A433WPV5_9BACT|nr:TonB-dependent receptor [Chitinophaga solisilvae]
MKPLLLTLLAICPYFAFLQANAQTRIAGKVTDEQQQPVSAATVALLRQGTAAPVKLEVSEKDGSFIFEGQPAGTYSIIVTAIGMLKYETAPFTTDSTGTPVTVPPVIMKKSDIALKEVAVTAQKKFVEQKIDRTVVNVDAVISNAGTSALDVLEKSPGVRVDQNGGISLKGQQGVTIYIDDKPSYLSGTDLQNFLRSMPASTLAQVEIMPNPPAKYDAAGNGGVINIKTAKRKIRGFNLGLNLSARVSKYSSSTNSFDFNYRNNMVNLFGNFGYGTRNNYNDIDIFRKYKNEDGSTRSIFTQNSYIHRLGGAYKGSFGADFYLSDKTTAGIIFNGLARYPKNRNSSTGTLYDAKNNPDSSVVSQNDEDGSFKYGGINLNLRHDFRKNGPSLLANFDYLTYGIDNDQTFSNQNFKSDGQLRSSDLLTGQLPSNIKIYAGKADYTHPLNDGWQLEAGAKTSYTKTSNAANYFNVIENISKPDYDKTNHFNYQENINAAYVNINKDFNRLSIQAGLRFESTSIKGHQLGNAIKSDSSFTRNYSNLFPTLFLLYKLDSLSNHQLKFNYGRRIDRPYYQDMNPFISPLDKFTYYVGNPYLQPSFSSKLELAYIFHNWLTASIGYSDTRDQVFETIEIVGNNYYSRPANIGRTTLTTIGLDASLAPTPWFSFQLSNELNFVHAKSDFYDGPLDTRSTYFYTQGLLQFKLKKNWTLQVDGTYQTRFTNAQFDLAGRGRVNAAVAKMISRKVSVKLSVSDIFFNNISQGTINNLRLTDATFRTLSDSRAAILTVSFRFGKAVEGQRKHNNSGADTEQNRVKN